MSSYSGMGEHLMPRLDMICPKCGAWQVYGERDRWGPFITCLMCGWQPTTEAPAHLGREPKMADPDHLSRLQKL